MPVENLVGSCNPHREFSEEEREKVLRMLEKIRKEYGMIMQEYARGFSEALEKSKRRNNVFHQEPPKPYSYSVN